MHYLNKLFCQVQVSSFKVVQGKRRVFSTIQASETPQWGLSMGRSEDKKMSFLINFLIAEFWCILSVVLCDFELQESENFEQETRHRPGIDQANQKVSGL